MDIQTLFLQDVHKICSVNGHRTDFVYNNFSCCVLHHSERKSSRFPVPSNWCIFLMDRPLFNSLSLNGFVGSLWKDCRSASDLIAGLVKVAGTTAINVSGSISRQEVSESVFYTLVSVQLGLLSEVCPVRVTGHLDHDLAACLVFFYQHESSCPD